MNDAQPSMTDTSRGPGRPIENKEPRTQMTIRIPERLARRFELLSLETRISVSNYVAEALEALWKDHPQRAKIERMLAAADESDTHDGEDPAAKPKKRGKS